MKVVTILGIPKSKGKTAHVIDIFERSLIIKGHEVKRFQISNHNIKGCIGCFSCMVNEMLKQKNMPWSGWKFNFSPIYCLNVGFVGNVGCTPIGFSLQWISLFE